MQSVTGMNHQNNPLGTTCRNHCGAGNSARTAAPSFVLKGKLVTVAPPALLIFKAGSTDSSGVERWAHDRRVAGWDLLLLL